MSTITGSVRINAPKDKVWEILSDFGGVINYNPGLSNSYSTSENNQGVGATRHCDLLPMGSIEERILEWNEGSDYLVDIYQFNGPTPPVKNALGRLSVETDGNETVASMELTYEMKLGFIGNAMKGLVLDGQYQKAVNGILQGLKYHVETGNQSTRAALKAALVTA